ncbi:MAG: hypothetical protein ABI183_19375 [Polyangiaceae bacterium]
MARPPSDSTPDSPSAPDEDASASDKASPPSDPPPSLKVRPALPERIDTIDFMPGTLIGAHLPPLLEAEAAKRAAQASHAAAPPEPVPPPTPTKNSDAADHAANDGSQEAWRSPFETRPAWLIALSNVPLRVWAMAVGGVVAGLLLVSAARGCAGKSRVDDLELRVAVLERTVGVSTDAGAVASSAPAATSANAASVNADKPATTAAVATAEDPNKNACAVAKLAAYQAWQGAADKAKALAAPAQAKCASFWTEAKKQACYGAASQNARSAESARDATIKGGAVARDAMKKVKDDPRNDAIGRARAASSTASDACQDQNEL